MVDPQLAHRYEQVTASIRQAAESVGRDPHSVTTIVVTKFHPPELVRELAQLGVSDVGESRHQEALPKYQECADLGLNWHFVGQLQSNKAKAVAGFCSTIHSLDRPSVLRALATIEHTVSAFIEVNLTDDPGRGGVLPVDLSEFTDAVLAVPSVVLRGLMAVAPHDEPPAQAFERVLHIRQGFLARAEHATELSLGMSGDFVEAIAAGATHLRIGTAITGKRPLPA